MVAFGWDCSPQAVSTEMSRGAAGFVSKWLPSRRLVWNLLQIAEGRVVVDDWTGQHPGRTSDSGLRHVHLLADPLVLAVPENHRLADPAVPVVLEQLLGESWVVAPEGERSRYGTDRLMAEVGGLPSAAWEFEGLGTILSLVSRGIGIAAVPGLAMVGAPAGLVYRSLPGSAPERHVYAVLRTGTLRRPAVQVTLSALREAARTVEGQLEELTDQALEG